MSSPEDRENDLGITARLDEPTSRLLVSYNGKVIMRFILPSLTVFEPGSVRTRRVIAWDFIRRQSLHEEKMSQWASRISPEGTQEFMLNAGRTGASVAISVNHPSPEHLILKITAAPEHSFMRLSWNTPRQEQWLGFGEHTHTIRPPAKFDSWVEEGPIGVGGLSRWLKWLPFVPFPKGPYPSYASLPLWLSSQGYSAWFESFAMMRWTLGTTLRTAEIWDTHVVLHIVAGNTPLEVLQQQFAVLGRPSLPPPWAFAPWAESVQGQDEALKTAAVLRQHRIPASAIWIEDWMGSQQDAKRFWMRPLKHRADTTLYPSFPTLSSALHAQGFRMLGYFCPEVTAGSTLYAQADQDRMLVRNEEGRPCRIDILGIEHGELDLTGPDASRWVQRHLFDPAYALGFDGWMADFGEYLPGSSQMADGSTGWETHNRYPLLWQAIHRNFWEEKRPDGDYVFFVRSGWIGTQALAPVFWGGDSDTDFEEADGLPTVIPELLSAQIAGFFYWATDIAGYMTFGLTHPSNRLLFWRWAELAALLPVMRTHHGTARPRNWNFRKDAPTLELYGRYSRLHTALYPYFHHLATVSSRLGHPLVRALYLQFPDDPVTWTLDQQFCLGDLLLAAPVTHAALRHTFYLPAGRWRCWWTGAVAAGGQNVTADVPADRLPLYIRHDSIVPLLEGAVNLETGAMEGIVDSLATIEQGPGVDLDSALTTLTLYANVSERSFTQDIFLPEGTQLRCEYQAGRRDGLPGPPALPPEHREHLPHGADFAATFKVMAGEIQQIFIGKGMLSLHPTLGSHPRVYIIRWWGDA